MIKVRIIKDWNKPNILRQTPASSGIWEDVEFTCAPISSPDYTIVSNHSSKKVNLFTYPDNIWSVQQEPPNEYFRHWHKGHKVYAKVYTTDSSLQGKRFIHSQPALPWHIEKSYDELVKCLPPKKTANLSFITSSKKDFVGHRRRMHFLERIKGKLAFDLFGYGINPLVNKWDGLAPYRYSLVVENYSGPYYWSEKLSDCFLAWTMPIYYGCTNITDYFPKDSLIMIDINSSNVIDQIKKIVASDLWLRRRKAVEKARNLILHHYQFFPFFVKQIHQSEKREGREEESKQKIIIPKENTFWRRFKKSIKQYL